jgi:hypothetical protein
MHHSQKADDEEARKILRNTHQGCDDTPGDRQRRQPKLWRGALENDVTGYFEEHVANEVKRETGQVLVSCHAKVGREALDSSVGHYNR